MKDLLDRLYNISLEIDENEMISIYGEHMGKWLWKKLTVDYHHDIIRWYGYLDEENRKKFATWIG